MDIKELKERIKGILENKKALDIEEVDLEGKTIIADYFIIVSGTNIRQIEALSENLDYELEKQCIYVKKIEGDKDSGWILMDYGDIIVHIFLKEEREKYSLEDLWQKR